MEIINCKNISIINSENKKEETKEELLTDSIVKLNLENLRKDKILEELGKQITLLKLELLKNGGK